MKQLYVVIGSLALAFSVQYTAMAQPPDFPLRCRGKAGMASNSERNLIVNFVPARGRADEGLRPGECSWLDRPLRNREPTRIVDERSSVDEARITAAHINQGDIHTFWVFNVGRFFRATASARGAPAGKPGRL
jgi:hypothetical protein